MRSRSQSTGQRLEATAINKALERAREMAASGVRSPDRIIAEVTHLLGERRRIRVIYVSMVDPNTMEPMRDIVPGRTLLAIAAWVDEVRLIDNTML
jgi:pantoate--beta-alanine ligase